jgi:hypothetical protein
MNYSVMDKYCEVSVDLSTLPINKLFQNMNNFTIGKVCEISVYLISLPMNKLFENINNFTMTSTVRFQFTFPHYKEIILEYELFYNRQVL